MSYLIRKANVDDIPRLEELLHAYMQETYHGAWGGTKQRLQLHLSGSEVKITIAETFGREVIALVAWVPTYDLHWCLKGGEVIDLFVCLPHRSRGVALLLITDVADEIQKQGGTYLKGGAVDSAIVHRLYQRLAMGLPGGEYYISGRAFRRLAELAGKKLREIISNLPEREWNREP